MGKNVGKRRKKVCFAASSGGHLEQLMMLKLLMDQYESCIITEKTSYVMDFKGRRAHYLMQINRKEPLVFVKLIVNVIKSLYIFLKEKPDAVVSTGALATIPICLLAKLFGRKLIFIESFAKITSPTHTGKLMYRFADQFYVQWESMLDFYPDAICLGGIY